MYIECCSICIERQSILGSSGHRIWRYIIYKGELDDEVHISMMTQDEEILSYREKKYRELLEAKVRVRKYREFVEAMVRLTAGGPKGVPPEALWKAIEDGSVNMDAVAALLYGFPFESYQKQPLADF